MEGAQSDKTGGDEDHQSAPGGRVDSTDWYEKVGQICLQCRMIPKILLISGLDPSGNAGLLRDLQMVYSMGLKVASVVSAVTAQNKRSFFSSHVVSPKIFSQELKSILPLSQYSAIKIGMLGDERVVKTLVLFLKKQKRRPPIVLDPVYRSTTGGSLLATKGRDLLFKELIPLVDLWTPNIEEACYFSGVNILSDDLMEEAAKTLWKKRGRPILIKGRYAKDKVKDLYFDGRKSTWFVYPRLNRRGLRGTGCAFSTLIACYLARRNLLPLVLSRARRQMCTIIYRSR